MKSTANPPSPELIQRLEACEANLRKHHRLSLAGTLIGATMHEVNNRLEALANYIYLAQCESNSPESSAQYLNAASEELRLVGEITKRSLSFVRSDLAVKDVDLVELAKAALALHQEQLARKCVNVEMKMASSAVAPGKRGELLQALVNLLLNSIEAIPHSGKLHVRVAARRGKAIITVADNGGGIPEAIRPSMFEPLKSSKDAGNGLGLWVVSRIIEDHHGRIRYRSSRRAHNSGTIFRIVLPTESGGME
jgi:signal transduction histidine kinase